MARSRALFVSALVLPALLANVDAARAEEHVVVDEFPFETVIIQDKPVRTTTSKKQKLRCPPGFVPISPIWDSRESSSPVIVESHLVDERTMEFTVRLAEPDAEDGATVDVGVDCIKKETKKADEKGVSHTHSERVRVVEKEVDVPGQGGFVQTGLDCPKGFSALAGLAELAERLRMTSSLRSADGKSWKFLLESISADAQKATVQAVCLGDKTGPAKQVKGEPKDPPKHVHAHKLGVVEKQVPIESGVEKRPDAEKAAGTVKCPKGSKPTGIGFSFIGHPFTYIGTYLRVGGTALFEFLNQSTEQTAELQVICLAKRTQTV